MPTFSHASQTESGTPADAHARANMALAILQQREHTETNIELAVMALRGASLDTLAAADRQMGED